MRLAQVGQRHYVMTKAAQGFNDGQREVLVCENARHRRSRSLVLANLSIDLVAMGSDVRPGVSKILGMKRRIRLEQPSFAHSKTPGLLQDPHGNPGAHDRGFTAADVGNFGLVQKLCQVRSPPRSLFQGAP